MLESLHNIGYVIAANWPVWLVTFVLILAAVIDGFELKVPNWVTFPLIISGWVCSALFPQMLNPDLALTWYESLGWSLFGTAVGLALLLPAYAIGGMGAGDVKLLAGVGAWMHGTNTFYAFCISAIVGAVLAVLMALWQRGLSKHSTQFWTIANEIMVIRDPNKLSEIAAARKPSMLLLPYGIPIAMGTILYFWWVGLLV